MSFRVKLTDAGLAMFAEAATNHTPVVISEVAIGDGGGAPIEPDQSMTELVNEIGRHPTISVTGDPDHPNWIVVNAVVPAESGDYWIREVGIYADTGDLIAIGSYPEQYKPLPSEGFLFDLNLNLTMMVTNASEVTIEDGGSVVYATRTYLTNTLQEALTWYVKTW